MSGRTFYPLPRHLLAAAALAFVVGTAALLTDPAAAGAVARSTTATSGVTKVLTNASNGTTTTVTKRWRVVVKLASRDGFDWSEASIVNATSEVVLKRVSGHISRNGSSTTTFDVVGYGAATLVATGTAKCAGPACNALRMNWSANVDSVVLDPPGPTG
jgi:hypothetical protein